MGKSKSNRSNLNNKNMIKKPTTKGSSLTIDKIRDKSHDETKTQADFPSGMFCGNTLEVDSYIEDSEEEEYIPRVGTSKDTGTYAAAAAAAAAAATADDTGTSDDTTVGTTTGHDTVLTTITEPDATAEPEPKKSLKKQIEDMLKADDPPTNEGNFIRAYIDTIGKEAWSRMLQRLNLCELDFVMASIVEIQKGNELKNSVWFEVDAAEGTTKEDNENAIKHYLFVRRRQDMVDEIDVIDDKITKLAEKVDEYSYARGITQARFNELEQELKRCRQYMEIVDQKLFAPDAINSNLIKLAIRYDLQGFDQSENSIEEIITKCLPSDPIILNNGTMVVIPKKHYDNIAIAELNHPYSKTPITDILPEYFNHNIQNRCRSAQVLKDKEESTINEDAIDYEIIDAVLDKQPGALGRMGNKCRYHSYFLISFLGNNIPEISKKWIPNHYFRIVSDMEFCTKCKQIGHSKYKCKKQRCAKCKSFNHDTKDHINKVASANANANAKTAVAAAAAAAAAAVTNAAAFTTPVAKPKPSLADCINKRRIKRLHRERDSDHEEDPDYFEANRTLKQEDCNMDISYDKFFKELEKHKHEVAPSIIEISSSDSEQPIAASRKSAMIIDSDQPLPSSPLGEKVNRVEVKATQLINNESSL